MMSYLSLPLGERLRVRAVVKAITYFITKRASKFVALLVHFLSTLNSCIILKLPYISVLFLTHDKDDDETT